MFSHSFRRVWAALPCHCGLSARARPLSAAARLALANSFSFHLASANSLASVFFFRILELSRCKSS
eukprot:793955-Rhodomonas_salina.1